MSSRKYSRSSSRRKQKQKREKEVKVIYSLAIISIIFSFFTLFPSIDSLEQDLPGEPVSWRAGLQIMINGADVPIPANIGVGQGRRETMYTTDWDGIIYIEAPNPSPKYRRLSKFFNNWGINFNNQCLFQYCSFGVQMIVNGKENHEFEQYPVEDGDNIILIVNTF